MHKNIVLESIDIAKNATKYILDRSKNESQARLIMQILNNAIKTNMEEPTEVISPTVKTCLPPKWNERR